MTADNNVVNCIFIKYSFLKRFCMISSDYIEFPAKRRFCFFFLLHVFEEHGNALNQLGQNKGFIFKYLYLKSYFSM